MNSGGFFSRGKLLLSGEYYVLYGAKALAVPTRFGQWMRVIETRRPGLLLWETFVQDKPWFTATFNLRDMSVSATSDEKTAQFLLLLLEEGLKLRAIPLPEFQGYYVETRLDFDIRWGLGSSSTLISNLAYWLDIDPFLLFRHVMPGSGYDLFCARASRPIIYQLQNEKPLVSNIKFFPSYHKNLYLVYSGRKQDSQESVMKFRQNHGNDLKIISEISTLTERMAHSGSLDEFISVMKSHEELLSIALGMPVIKQERFPDFDGEIKSLGAWGGDFILAASRLPLRKVKEYFLEKNLSVIFRYDEIVY